ncbi:lysosomal enzyme receptor protein [Halictus rubicundus]|uniref:lysosomal enzyme receptor protein n=1 Tax=Halictus rubicundus TaxID=77578 RepID=UPI004036E1D5
MCKLIVSISLYWFAVIAVFAQDTSTVNDNSFCIIQEPVLKIFKYNFSSLSDSTKDIILPNAYLNETLRVQLCTPLKQKCNGTDGYGICLIKDKQEIGIGKSPPVVELDNGRILFMFTGTNCTLTDKYSVTITMKCNYKVENNSIPELLTHEKVCEYSLLWKTALACGPQTQQNCTVTNNGSHYDLSSLTNYTENYVIRTGNGNLPKIILNVCHNVIFGYKALCQIKSGACLQQNSSKVEYMNLGDVAEAPFFEDGKLKIKYKNGDVCRPNITTPDIQTTISFICDFEARDTRPEYIGGSEKCHYQIIWKTVAACSTESLRSHSAITAGRCTVTNPLTNFTYNLQSLMKKEHYATAQNGITYTFGVCKSPANMTCSLETGICSMKNGTSMGKYNTNLIWQEGGPYLNYTNGDFCENGQRHYTTIAFVCGAEGVSNEPFVMEQKPCQLSIHWNTDLVCEKRIKCVAIDDDEMNLSSLIKSSSNYVVKVNKTEFHINICRPLVPEPSLTCAHGSAVCKSTLNSSKKYINESLGFPKESPVLDANRDTVLRYVGGSPCPEDPTTLISSNFTFPCNIYSDKGFPEFKDYKDCTYIFEWKTSITCGAAMGTWISPCIIQDHLSHECDLSPLYKSQPIYHVKNKQGKDYSVNICGGGTFCNGSAVCQSNNGYGSLANVIFDYGRDVIKLQYSNGDKCVNTSYTSGVRFICVESVGIGEPKPLWESQCNVEFEWYTNVTCACKSSTQHLPTSVDADEGVKMFSPSYAGTIASIVLSVIALVAVLFYFLHLDWRTWLRSCWHPFSSRRSSGRVQYCRVNTTEEARLLLDVDPTHCQTDSDDDLLVA